ncbi:MAG: hypothetical protein E5V86_12365 [Mesorhizobium sp.]|nr:MAG: hypothetical protein E5V86_12365 [Mesorhizobium sp.]
MDDGKILAYLQQHYVLFAFIPVVSGACFIAGFLFPLSPHAIEVVSYVDLINFAIYFSVFALYVAFCVGVVSLWKRFLEGSYGITKVERIVKIATIVSIFVLATNIVSSAIWPSLVISFVSFAFMLVVGAPIFYTYLLQEHKIGITSLTVTFVIAGSIGMGGWFGSIKRNYIRINDQVCTDSCYRVGVYAMLSEFAIGVDCNGRVMFFPRSELKRVIIGKRPSSVSDTLAKVGVDDGSQCLDEPLIKN